MSVETILPYATMIVVTVLMIAFFAYQGRMNRKLFEAMHAKEGAEIKRLGSYFEPKTIDCMVTSLAEAKAIVETLVFQPIKPEELEEGPNCYVYKTGLWDYIIPKGPSFRAMENPDYEKEKAPLNFRLQYPYEAMNALRFARPEASFITMVVNNIETTGYAFYYIGYENDFEIVKIGIGEDKMVLPTFDTHKAINRQEEIENLDDNSTDLSGLNFGLEPTDIDIKFGDKPLSPEDYKDLLREMEVDDEQEVSKGEPEQKKLKLNIERASGNKKNIKGLVFNPNYNKKR